MVVRTSEKLSSIMAGGTMPLWQRVSRPTPPPLFSRPARTPLPPWGGGRQRTPPFTQGPGQPLPDFEWQGKIPSPPAFLCKSAGDCSCTTARFSFLGRGVPGQPPRQLFFRASGPPSPHGGGVGRQPPLRSRSCRLVRGRGCSREPDATPEDSGSGGGIFR